MTPWWQLITWPDVAGAAVLSVLIGFVAWILLKD